MRSRGLDNRAANKMPIGFCTAICTTKNHALLRKAFDDVLRDPAFLAEAEKAGMKIEPLTGVEIAAMLAKAYGAPKPIVERMIALIEPPAVAGKAK